MGMQCAPSLCRMQVQEVRTCAMREAWPDQPQHHTAKICRNIIDMPKPPDKLPATVFGLNTFERWLLFRSTCTCLHVLLQTPFLSLILRAYLSLLGNPAPPCPLTAFSSPPSKPATAMAEVSCWCHQPDPRQQTARTGSDRLGCCSFITITGVCQPGQTPQGAGRRGPVRCR